MASHRFFAYDPYDYYYASPYNHYPYPYYHHHQQQQPAAPARRTSGFFFPVAADAEPTAVRTAAASPAPRARSVSIPVHFVGDSNPKPEWEMKAPARPPAEPAAVAPEAVVPVRRAPSSAEAAVTIQAAARGFMARKSVRAVRDVEREAEDVQRKVEREAEDLRGDARARIAVGEALMRLLLRLDAVRGAREYRRRVTKRVLALQDAVDALEPKTAPTPVAEENELEPVAVEMVEEDTVDQELPDTAEHGSESEAKPVSDEMEVDGEVVDGQPGAAEETGLPSDGAILVGGKKERSGAGTEGEWEMVTEEHAAPASPAAACQELESRTTADAGVPDARKVMEMVATLCERSVQQCAMIGALAERVDALERAVRRVENAERRRRRAKKLRKEGKGSNRGKFYSD